MLELMASLPLGANLKGVAGGILVRNHLDVFLV